MMHASTIAGSIVARRIVPRTPIAPSCVAVNPLSAPRNFPVGVRTALTMTESGMLSNADAGNGVGAKHRLQSGQNNRLRAPDLARPPRTRRLDDQDAVLELDGRRPL